MSRVAIVGGGAAGFFMAVCLKERAPHADVTILESGRRVLRKVKVSGGGRCNCTNSFRDVADLSSVYPRGHRLMKRLLKGFSPDDAYRWWEEHGVRLVTQEDGCVFPQSQDSQEVIDCLLRHARRLGVRIVTERRIDSLEALGGYDFVCIATGGMSAAMGDMLAGCAEIQKPVPSLFSLSIDDRSLTALAGLVVDADVRLAGTSFAASGPLLITHWGVSGPAALKLSSYAARHLNESGYRAMLSVNWLRMNEAEARSLLSRLALSQPKRRVANTHPEQIPARLWEHIVSKALSPRHGDDRGRAWCEFPKKDMNRLVETLVNDRYQITGRAAFRDEFVTCGGVSLASVNPVTLECKSRPNLFFAGEALDIDGITGGFNFQCAWTTAYTVAMAIASRL